MNAITIASSTERFIVTLFTAIVVHSLMIYFVSFSFADPIKPLNTTMEVILVQKTTQNVSQEAEYLAQANNEGGGGNEGEKARPTTPMIAPFPDQTADIVATPPPKQVATVVQTAQIKQLTTHKPAKHQVAQRENQLPVEKTTQQEEIATDLEDQPLEEEIPASTLIMNSLAAISSIQPELDEKFSTFTNHKREKFVSPNTREYQYAAYVSAWTHKVERIGTLNFPKQAHRNKVSGRLMVDVAINADGTIQKVQIKKSSGHKILDDAALRIAHLAAPFSAFSEEMHEEYDVLHITCWWNFDYESLTTN